MSDWIEDLHKANRTVLQLKQQIIELKKVWLPCDQTVECVVCGFIDWDEAKHSDDCPIGYMANQLAAANERIRELSLILENINYCSKCNRVHNIELEEP